MLLFAALLIFLLALAHSILGERYILVRLFQRSDLPRLFGGTAFTTQTLRFAWHITTVAWFGLGALLVAASQGALTQDVALKIIGITAIASGLLPLFFTRGKHLSWVVMFAVAALVFWAAAG